jgi:hypothetical protein
VPASSDPISAKNWSGAATRSPCGGQPDHRQARAIWRICRAWSFSKATCRSRVRRPRRRRHGVRAPPGGDSVGAPLGQRPDHLESRPTSTPRSAFSSRRATPGSRRVVYAGSSVGVWQYARRCPSARTCRPTRCRPMRSRSWMARQYCPDVHAALWPGNGRPSVTSIVYRAAAGSRLAVLGGDLAVLDRRCSTDASPPSTATARQSRDFTYVANVVDGVMRAAEATDGRPVMTSRPAAASPSTTSSQ